MINKKLIVIIIILLSILVIPAWMGCQCPGSPGDETTATSDITAPVATEPDTEETPDIAYIPEAADAPVMANASDTPLAPLPKPVLNLEIPEEHLLMDTAVEVPEKESWLKGLFRPRVKEKHVKVGGGLILDEKKPVDPNAAVWDQVKGAEVGVTIETR